MNKGKNTAKGITLIALVITIIVMLILVAVTINIALNGGLFGYAKDATTQTKSKMEAESQLASGRIKIGDVWYDSPQDYADDKPSADQTDGGSGSSTGGGTQNPTQEYTWEKYSFNITTASNSKENGEIPLMLTNGSTFYVETQGVTRYGRIQFISNNTAVCALDSWTGNLKEYYVCEQYKNYPFDISFNSYNCEYYVWVSYGPVNNAYNACGMTGTALPYMSFTVSPNANMFTSSIAKGSYKYGEVQSTDQTAYPQNGFKDGYWYVLKQS